MSKYPIFLKRDEVTYEVTIHTKLHATDNNFINYFIVCVTSLDLTSIYLGVSLPFALEPE
jgi:hypothetical protein